MSSISEQYFNWIINTIFDDFDLLNSYFGLLVELNNITFEYSIAKDANRQKDAQDFRYIFGDANGYPETYIAMELDIQPPTLLEVIAALINRVQDNILCDFEHGIKNQDIFIDMLRSLHIDDLCDRRYLSSDDMYQLQDSINRLYNRDYSYYGEGGLFTVQNPQEDMRRTEIWFQFMWYLNEKLGGRYL